MDIFSTNDLSFSAYLIMHGVPLKKAKRLGKSFQFSFEGGERVKNLQLQYITSESAKFDDAVRKLKKLVFGDGSCNNH